jgi:alpha-beta hydrolase superfamily lysophospholipase
MQETPFELPMAGARLGAVQWLPDDAWPLRGTVQVVHGMAEHSARYRGFAGALAAHGFAVYAADHPGHGRSVPPGEPHGHFADSNGWQRVLDGVRALDAAVAQRHPGVPRFLFGHSMGAFIARHHVLRDPGALSGLILSASSVRYGALARLARRIARFERRRLGARSPSRLMNALSFGSFNLRFFPARTPSDWLSRDIEQVDRYLADPWCGFACSTQFWVDQLGGMIELESLERAGQCVPRHLPVLMLAGTRDPVSRGGKGLRQLAAMYRRAGLCDIELRLYRGGRHELLNETNREEVCADIGDWLARRSAQASTALR